MRRNREITLLLGLLLTAIGCGGEESSQGSRPRCGLCGMVVEPDSGWRSGGRDAEGTELSFDTPKCLLRQHRTRGPVTEPWVIEYYSQARRPADVLFYVIGSDVEGPMGRDLVPVEGRDRADGFREDHGGARVLSFEEVSGEVVDELFRPRG